MFQIYGISTTQKSSQTYLPVCVGMGVCVFVCVGRLHPKGKSVI